MAANDTSKEAEEVLCRLYRNMTMPRKAQRIFSAYRVGKMLSMAGIRMNHPDASEEQVWLGVTSAMSFTKRFYREEIMKYKPNCMGRKYAHPTVLMEVLYFVKLNFFKRFYG